MLKKTLLIMGMIILTFSLGACAAQTEKMVYGSAPIGKPKNTSLTHNIAIAGVTGGEKTNPLWKSKISNESFSNALQQSLQQSHLYQQLDGARYNLSVTLLKLNQPSVGLSFTVSCLVRYQLLDTKTNKYIFRKDIWAYYTAKLSSSLIGGKRLEIATEGAAKQNIQQLIANLYALPSSKSK